MKQVFFLLLFTLFFISDSHGQYISQERGFLSKKYMQEGVQLRSKKQFLAAVKNNPEVHGILTKSFKMSNAATVISALGGFGIGLGSTANIDASESILLAGLGLLVASIPLSIVSDNNSKKAISLYNEDYKPEDMGLNSMPILNLEMTSNGVGLVMSF